MTRRRVLVALAALLLVGAGAGLIVERTARARVFRDNVRMPARADAVDEGPPRVAPPDLSHAFHDGTTDVSTNAEGLRADPVPADGTGEVRILCLGDSGTFGRGLGLEDTWPWRLQALLRERGIRARVINAGCSGYGGWEASSLLQWLAPRYHPQIVVAMLGYSDMQRVRIRGCWQPLVPPTAAERMLARSWSGLAWLRSREKPWQPVYDSGGSPIMPTTLAWWDGAAANMRWMAEYCADQGIRFLAVSEPLRVMRDEFSRDAPMPDEYDALKRAYREMGARNGVPVVTMDEAFAASGQPESELFNARQSPTHTSPKGAAIVADTLGAEMLRLGWLNQRGPHAILLR